jgi:hypothetical protein
MTRDNQDFSAVLWSVLHRSPLKAHSFCGAHFVFLPGQELSGAAFASPKWVRSARKEMMVEYSITCARTKGSVKRRNGGEGQAKFILLLLAIPLA